MRAPLLSLMVSTALLGSCGNAQEGLKQELESFVTPAHLILIQQSEEGPSRCFAGDCPRIINYYASEQPLETTCADVQEAVRAWDVDDAEWGSSPCSLSTTRGGDEVAVAVYEADELPPSVIDEIEPSDLGGYRSAVLIMLTRD